MATLRDVADAAGVHPGTASRALNPETKHLVSPTTMRRVRRAARQLGYVPNTFARSLRTARSRSIGVIIPDITNPLFPPMMRALEDTLGAESYHLLTVNTDNDPAREASQVEHLRNRGVDGIVLASASTHDPTLVALHEQRVPTVLINRQSREVPLPSVVPDEAAGIRQALSHLRSLGHQRIMHVAGPPDTATGMQRRRTFADAMVAHGLPFAEEQIVAARSYSFAEGARCAAEAVDSGLAFTAVVAANDLLAVGALGELERRGLPCPDRVSIIGFNDIPMLDRLRPPLTTVRVPAYQIGEEAARLILDRLDDPEGEPTHLELPVSLVVRGSTSSPDTGASTPVGA